MATVGAKNQPLVQTTDNFNPVADINTLANWVATNYANFKVLSGANTHTGVTGADLFAGLVVWETSTSQFWQYTGLAWKLLPFGGGNPTAIATQSGTISCTTGTYTLVTFNSVTLQGGIAHSAGIFTLPNAGNYTIAVTCGWETGAASTYREVDIDRSQNSGSTWSTLGLQRTFNSASATTYQSATVTLDCNSSDQIRIRVVQNSGSTLNASGATVPIRLTITYVG